MLKKKVYGWPRDVKAGHFHEIHPMVSIQGIQHSIGVLEKELMGGGDPNAVAVASRLDKFIVDGKFEGGGFSIKYVGDGLIDFKGALERALPGAEHEITGTTPEQVKEESREVYLLQLKWELLDRMREATQ